MTAPPLAVEGLTLLRSGKTILDRVDWTVRPGEHWALVGANGSGKSTLLKAVTGEMWATRGTVRVLGETLGRADVRQLRRRIGTAASHLQEWIPPDRTALSVVLSGRSASFGYEDPPAPSDCVRALGLLDRFSLSGLAARPYAVLSQGEKQKVLIARALLPDPPLLLLDEPCAGLDLGAREELLRLFDTLLAEEGRTLVLVTHHIEEIRPGFTHLLLLRQGRVLAQGRTGETLTSARLAEAFGFPVTAENRAGRYWARTEG